MRYTQEDAQLLFRDQLSAGIFSFTLRAPAIAAAAVPGQFVQILCEGFQLRRPISIAGFDGEQGILRLIFEIRGQGTDWLSQREAGETLNLIGPLGHGFPLLDAAKKAVFVGGGIGTPPLLPLARWYKASGTAITGFRNQSAVILQDDFRVFGSQTVLCTDDGSAGFHGFTTQALEQVLGQQAVDVVYTCGPKKMMQGVATICERAGVTCYVSMEERMGCGVGACMGCTCRTKTGDGAAAMTRVCLNGPVFLSTEVDFS